MEVTMQGKIDAVRAKVADCIKIAESKFGIKMPAVEIRFDLTGRAAGMAGRVNNSYYLRFNVQHMNLGGKTWDHLINDTVPHEVAHSVCQAFPQYGRNHNTGWKRVCIALGGNGQRCYSAEDAPEAVAKQRPFTYISTSGHAIPVSPTIHRKIQNLGMTYRYRGELGKIHKQCAFTVASPLAVVAPKQATVAPKGTNTVTAPATGGSKADMIRARIAQAKARYETPSVVVQYGVEVLGMSLSLAKTYVKNNWEKA